MIERIIFLVRYYLSYFFKKEENSKKDNIYNELDVFVEEDPLFIEEITNGLHKQESNISTIEFVHKIISSEFVDRFEQVQGFQMMFKSKDTLIYFQNFNKESDKLWYRITENPMRIFRESSKDRYIFLTNPTEKVAYKIPFEDIESKVNEFSHYMDFLEINIDHIRNKWNELDWYIGKYLIDYSE